ncbi:MAG: tryptophanase [bacterium]|nr:tryptophanase [bacterium]
MESPLDYTRFPTAHHPRAHVNAYVRLHHPFTPEERLKAAEKAGWNVFQFPSEMLQGGDLLSDSGTTAMTVEQLSALILGDEAYGSNWGYFQLLDQFSATFGIALPDWEIYLFHQGRAAEHALFSNLTGERLVIPSNSFFDTTRANAEANKIEALDLVDHSFDADPATPFKGNIDLVRLEQLLKERGGDAPFVHMTITNNTGGGQPVSLANLKATKELSKKYDKPFFLDACRFAENAWFIKKREKGYENKSVADIVKEEFALADGFIISLKKDGLANMGGVLAIKKGISLEKRYPGVLESLRDHQILTEGHPTYGGLSGRDIMTIIEGLRTVVKEEYLAGRIGLVEDFGAYMSGLGVPLVEPFGGHAVYIDIDKFFEGTNMTRGDFGGIALTALLLLKGVRLCELGAFAFGRYDLKTKTEQFPERNYVRAAVPRNKYERDDLYYVADCVKGLYDLRGSLPKAVPIEGREKTLRHFKARFALR